MTSSSDPYQARVDLLLEQARQMERHRKLTLGFLALACFGGALGCLALIWNAC